MFRKTLFSALGFLLLVACGDSNSASGGQDRNSTDTLTIETIGSQDQDTLAQYYNDQGDNALFASDYTAAVKFYEQSIEIALKFGDSTHVYDSRLDMAGVYARMGQFERAVSLAEPAVEAFQRSGDSTRIGRSYATIAGHYLQAGKLEKGREAIKKALPILEKHGSLIERCAAMNQLAFTYSDQGNWEQALPCLDSALALMRASGFLDQLPGLTLNLADCHRRLGHYPEARRLLNEALPGADTLGQIHVKARILERLSQVSEATGDYKSALLLFQQAKNIRDSLFKDAKVKELQELQVQYETKEKEHEIQVLKDSERSARQARNLAMSVAGLSVLLLLAGVCIVFILFQHRRRFLKQNRQHLHELTQMLIEKNGMLAEQVNRIAELENNPPPGGPENVHEAYNHHILTSEDWVRFLSYFENLYPGYLRKLRAKFPDLTEAEERLFLFIKLNISNKETAVLLGVTQDSVKKTRYRLRKRLNLDEGMDLETFVRTFE